MYLFRNSTTHGVCFLLISSLVFCKDTKLKGLYQVPATIASLILHWNKHSKPPTDHLPYIIKRKLQPTIQLIEHSQIRCNLSNRDNPHRSHKPFLCSICFVARLKTKIFVALPAERRNTIICKQIEHIHLAAVGKFEQECIKHPICGK